MQHLRTTKPPTFLQGIKDYYRNRPYRPRTSHRLTKPRFKPLCQLAKLKLPKKLLEADNSLFNSYNLSDGKFEEALPVKLYYEL